VFLLVPLHNSLLEDPSEFDPTKREQRKNLVTSIIAGIATGLGSNHVAAVTNSAQIETENNNLKKAVGGLGDIIDVIDFAKMIRLKLIKAQSEKNSQKFVEKIDELKRSGARSTWNATH
jgi:hypothetical protein